MRECLSHWTKVQYPQACNRVSYLDYVSVHALNDSGELIVAAHPFTKRYTGSIGIIAR
jgi:hypothetical protein